MSGSNAPRPSRSPAPHRWESQVLRWLAYPAALALTGLAGFVLALGVVTWLMAAVAVGRSLQRWSEGDDRTFTNTFRELGATWRRTWLPSLAASVVLALVVLNIVFLTTRDSPVAVLLIAATVPLAAMFCLVLIHVPAAAALAPDQRARGWALGAVRLVVAAPGRSLAVLMISATWLTLCTIAWTLVPFLAVSVPVYAGLVASRRTTAALPGLLNEEIVR